MNQTTICPSLPTGCVLGVSVSCASMSETLEALCALVGSGKPHLVVTANPTGFVLAQSDPDYRRIYENADFVTADGLGVVLALRKVGCTAHRVAGVDLLCELCALSAERGYRVYLVGAAPGVAQLAAEKLALRYPGCNIVGTHHGFFPADDDDLVAREIALAKPDLLFVALGMPRQEKFIWRTRDIVRASVAIGVGGSFDVVSGLKKRAPKWVRSLGLEWVWRSIQEPKRLGKLSTLPRFVWLVMRNKR